MIELIAIDVDGTLTDGKIIYSDSGDELKGFSVKDGLAISTWIKMGKKVAFITGRESKIVERRAKELNVTYLYQNCKDKGAKLKEIAKNEGLSLSQIAAVGDDLNDLSMLKVAMLSFAPKDCSNAIKPYVSNMLTKNGGDGAIREMIEYILKNDNIEEQFIALWQ